MYLSQSLLKYTVKPEIFTTFLISQLSRIRKIHEIKKSEKFSFFTYLTVRFGVCRAIMGVNITTKYYKVPNTLSSGINSNEKPMYN